MLRRFRRRDINIRFVQFWNPLAGQQCFEAGYCLLGPQALQERVSGSADGLSPAFVFE
jgi:hypothetical protein